MDNNWLQYAPASNKLKQTYVRGFMDISGNVIIRGGGGLNIAGGNVIGITKTMVGLSNVDNTTDANKPVSTAQQTALDLKANLASPTFTGTVTIPANSITNTTVSTSITTGALLVAGGVGIGGSVNIGGNTRITGGLIIDGSLNVTGNIMRTDIQSKVYISEQVDVSNSGTGPGLIVRQFGAQDIAAFYDDSVQVVTIKDGGDVSMNNKLYVGGIAAIINTSISNSTTTGALQVAGGVGIGGNLYVGGTTVGVTKTMVGLSNVDNTSDASKPISTTQQTALDLKAPIESPTFTGTVGGITKTMVGLSNIDNTSDVNKPVSTAQQTALDLKANLASPTFTGTVTTPATSITNTTDSTSNTTGALLVAGGAGIGGNLYVGGTTVGITKTMVGLSNLDNTSDANKPVSSAQQTALDLKAPLASPTFTGTVGGITQTMVGLGNVDNTSDVNKPISTTQQSALDLKAPIASPTFTGTITAPATSITNTTESSSTTSGALLVAGGVGIVGNLYVGGTAVGITKTMVGLGNVDDTSDASKPVSTAQQTALDLKANLASPTFTGTVSGITNSMVGLSNVDNTSDANKPISTAQQTALDLKAPLASPTFTGTVTTPATSITNTTDSTSNTTGALQVVGGVGIGGNLYVGGTAVGITKTMVGLGNVDNTSDANKPVSTTQQTALDLKAPIESPTFTGTVGGITKSMVGLGNVDNTSDASKPVSTAQQTALDLKANLASPTFTGTVTIPTTSITNTTVSTSKTTGALRVVGGAGIGGNAYIGENASIGGSCKIGTSSLLKMMVAISDNSEIYSSSDGITWTDTNGGIGNMNACIKYNETYWIALSKQYGQFIKSYDGITWTPGTVNTIPSNANFEFDWNGAYWLGAYFNNDSVTILTSTDGLNWTGTNGSGIDTTINSVLWVPTLSKWVITYVSELRYSTSSDGISWTIYEEALSWNDTYYLNGDVNTNVSSPGYTASKLKWGGSNIIGYSPNNNAIYSSDGITWAQTNLLSGIHIDTIDYNETIWMAISYNGISTSLDGITWTSVHTFDVAGLMIYSSIIRWNGTYWLTYSTEGTMKSMDSGATWTLVDDTTLSFLGIELGSVSATVSSINPTTGALVVSGGVGVGGNANIGGNLMASGTITINNTKVSTSMTTGALIVNGGAGIGGNAYIGKNTFIGEICKIGLFSQSNILLAIDASDEIYISNNGIDWSSTNFQFPNIDSCIRYNGDYWLAFSRYFNLFVKSFDGVTWDPDLTNEQAFGPVNTTFEFDWNGVYWLGAYAGTILKSTDGLNWTSVTTGPDINSIINSVIWVPTLSKWFITYASNYKYATSSNGIDWTIYEETLSWQDTSSNYGENSNTISPGYTPSKLKFGGSKIVGYINSGYLIYSTDGINWSNPNMETTTYPGINNFIYWNGVIWLFMNDDGFFTSPDLITWTSVYTFSANSVITVDTPFIRWFGTYWLAYDSSQRIFKSENNGVTWTLVNNSYNIDFNAIEFGSGSVSITSSNSSNGALIVSGGAGISGDINVGRNLNVSGEMNCVKISIPGGMSSGSTGTTITGKITSVNTTISTSTTTGALTVSGGVGIIGNLYVGGTIIGGMVGLSNVDNTSDANKPVSTAQQTALDLKANLASPTFTGTVGGITKSMVDLGNVDNTADTAKPVSTAQQTALDLKAPLASPTFTGTVGGITKSMIDLGNVDNTADTAKPVSTAQQTALDLKAPLASPTFTGTVGGITKSMVDLANVDNTADTAKPVSTAQQTALDLKANLASPTFTGTVGGITKSMVGLGNVNDTADTAKPVSTAQQTALDLKANLASPTFTGTVSGITKSMVDLGNVDNTSDASKPVSTAQQTALDLKAAIASPTFTGTVTTPATSITNNTNSTNTASGALQVTGGAGIGGNVFIGGNTRISGGLTVDGSFNVTGSIISTTVRETVRISERVDISNSGTGPGLTVRQYGTASIAEFYDDANLIMVIKDLGDISMNKTLTVGGIASIKNTTVATSTASGALQVSGGAGIGGNAFIGGNVNVGGNIFLNTGNSVYVNGVVLSTGGGGTSGNVVATSTTVSTSTSTGALIVSGGAGIVGNVYVGGNTVVGGNLIVSGTTSFAAGTISGASITASTIPSGKFATGAIATTDIADSAITGAKIAASTIPAGKFATGAIATADIADSAITGAKIAASTITSGKFATGAISTADIADSAITGAKIAVGTITGNLLSSTATTTGTFTINNSTASINTSSGALQVVGGAGIGGNAFVGGNIYLNSARNIYNGIVPLVKTTTLVDFTTLSTDTFYVLQISYIPTGVVDSTIPQPIEFYIVGDGLLNNDPFPDVTLYGQVRLGAGGWNSIGSYHNFAQYIRDGGFTNPRFYGIYRTSNGYNIFIYARGGYKYSVTTNGTVSFNISSTTDLTSSGYGTIFRGVKTDGTIGTGLTTGSGFTTMNDVGNNAKVIGMNLNTANSLNVTITNLGSRINNTMASTDASTGALIVGGGAGIGGAVNIAGILDVYNSTASTSTATGALQVIGGAGIGGAVNVGGIFDVYNSTASTSTATGALQVVGGAGIGGNVYVGGNINLGANGNIYSVGGVNITSTSAVFLTNPNGIKIMASMASTSADSGALQVVGGAGISGNAYVGGNIFLNTGNNVYVGGVILSSGGGGGSGTSGNLVATSTTASTNTSTGALIVSGGAGIAGNVYVGGNIIMTGANNNSTRFGYLAFNSGTGSNNTAFGASALNANTTSINNTAVGASALTLNTGSNNTAFGTSAGSRITTGIDNTLIGSNAGLNISTTTGSIAIGFNAMGNVTFAGTLATTSYDNICIGNYSGKLLTGATAANNLAIGAYSLGGSLETTNSTTGDDNVVIGNYSGKSITSGNYNTGLGTLALGGRPGTLPLTGQHNICLGHGAGGYISGAAGENIIIGVNAGGITTGSSNVVMGHLALTNNTLGTNNTCIGHNSAQSLTSGNSNTALGSGTVIGNGVSNSTAIGVGATVSVSNQIVLGRATESVFIPGTTASTSTATGALQVIGGAGIGGNVFAGGRMNAVTFNSTSDSRIKENVISIDRQIAIDKLRELEPCTYSLIEQPTERTYGFIAQEISQVLPEAVSLTTNCVPSIYEFAFVEGRKITLVNKTIDLSWKRIKISDKVLDILQIVDDKTFYISTDIDVIPVDIECQPLVENLGQYKYKNGEIYTGIVKTGAFVYGNEIDDFHMLDKDVIWAVTTRATQELDRQLQEAKQTIRNQDTRISQLEEEIALIKEHLRM
jgi:hypothetical protein